MTVIKTSKENWLDDALKLYVEKKTFSLIDDAKLGLENKDMKSAISLLAAAKKKGNFSVKQLISVLAGLGITGLGVYLVILAIADPEPTTKLGFLIGGGILLALTGALGTLASLGVKFSVSAKDKSGNEFTIKPE